MGAHLRPLPRCQKCQAPATQMLYNAANARIGEYCEKHAGPALSAFIATNPDQKSAWLR